MNVARQTNIGNGKAIVVGDPVAVVTSWFSLDEPSPVVAMVVVVMVGDRREGPIKGMAIGVQLDEHSVST